MKRNKIINTACLVVTFLAVWGVDVSYMAKGGYIYTFWGTIWSSTNYLHFSLFMIMLCACVLWVNNEEKSN